MDIEKIKELKKLTLKEFEFRRQWHEAVTQLQDLVQPITDHNGECYRFWEENFPNALEIIVILDKETTYKIAKPKRESATQQSYLPYGIDYSECQVINIGDLRVTY
jgi:hypothetical protein